MQKLYTTAAIQTIAAIVDNCRDVRYTLKSFVLRVGGGCERRKAKGG